MPVFERKGNPGNNVLPYPRSLAPSFPPSSYPYPGRLGNTGNIVGNIDRRTPHWVRGEPQLDPSLFLPRTMENHNSNEENHNWDETNEPNTTDETTPTEVERKKTRGKRSEGTKEEEAW